MSGYHLITLTYDKLRTYLNAPNYRLLPLVGSSLSKSYFPESKMLLSRNSRLI